MTTTSARIAILIASLLTASTTLAATAPPPDFTQFEASVRSEMDRTDTPGAAVLVIADGKEVFRKTFGVESTETQRPLREDALFRIGSTTKMFVALAAVRLASEGKLDFSEPVARYVDGLHPAIGRLTMNQILSHTGGLSDDAPMHGPLEETALAERIRSWDESVFFTEPGRIFSYANPGYALAGLVILEVFGRPLEETMQSLVLEPM